MTATITVIIAYDLKFYDKLPKLFPQNPAMRGIFENNPQLIEATAKRNSSLSGSVFDTCGPCLGTMSQLKLCFRERLRRRRMPSHSSLKSVQQKPKLLPQEKMKRRAMPKTNN